MAAHHLTHEGGLGARHVRDELARLRIPAERHEVDRMALAQRHPDLAVCLEAADARAVPGAGVDDDVGAARVIDVHTLGRQDAQQHVVGRKGQVLAIHDHFVVVHQHRRAAGGFVFQEDVAPLAQGVQAQHRAFGGVAQVVAPGLDQGSIRASRLQASDQVTGFARLVVGARCVRSADALRVLGRGRGEDVGRGGGRPQLFFHHPHRFAEGFEHIAPVPGDGWLLCQVEQVKHIGHEEHLEQGQRLAGRGPVATMPLSRWCCACVAAR